LVVVVLLPSPSKCRMARMVFVMDWLAFGSSLLDPYGGLNEV
jgi:hypothetical protein